MNTTQFYPIRSVSEEATTIASESRSSTIPSTLRTYTTTLSSSSTFTPISSNETPSIINPEIYLNGPEKNLIFFEKAKEALSKISDLFEQIRITEQIVHDFSKVDQKLPLELQKERIIKKYGNLILNNEEDFFIQNEKICFALKITYFLLGENLEKKEDSTEFAVIEEIGHHASNIGGTGAQRMYEELLSEIDPLQLNQLVIQRIYEKTAETLLKQSYLFDERLQKETTQRAPYLEIAIKQEELKELRNLRASLSSILYHFTIKYETTLSQFGSIEYSNRLSPEIISHLSSEWGIANYRSFTKTMKNAISFIDKTIENVLEDPLLFQGEKLWKQSIQTIEQFLIEIKDLA